MRRIAFLIITQLVAFSAFTQVVKPISWSVESDSKEVKAGDEIQIEFNFKLEDTWYLYSNDFDPELGPTVTTFDWQKTEGIELVGGVIPVNPKRKHDEIFDGEISYFMHEGKFIQKAKVISKLVNIEVVVDYQVCTTEDGMCIPFTDDFSMELGSNAQLTEASLSNSVASSSSGAKDGLLGFAIFAFIGGLLALLTPCVFPMIPMTVTFFTKSKGGKQHAFIYGLSIIAIYVLAGTVVAAINGPDFANWLSTHWIPNIFFFLVFVIFAMSFLGMFEITLPSRFVNKIDQKSDKGGLVGVFFMAFTLVLVSFSCTGPIVGSVLVAAAGGEILMPIVGMLSFSLAFAIPFTLFAIFPQWLNSLPKSGGWLNSVKVVLGFVELALGLKFLSVADQTYHWGLLDREIYIALWIVIFTMMGFYLLGKLRLPHDSPMDRIPVPRVLMAIVTFAFVVMLIPGMWGAPLRALSGYLPPMSTHDFNISEFKSASHTSEEGFAHSEKNEICEEPVYGDLFQLDHGINAYFEINQALKCAREQNKPIFIDFTGHGCVNCREMEARVWSDPKVLQILKEDYVVVALYVDDKTKLPENQWYISDYDGKRKKSIGKQNADYQIIKYNTNAQPFYVLVNPFSEEKLVDPKAYDLNVNNFVEFLEKGKQTFNQVAIK